MTFNKGGATEFARSFFRVAEGKVEICYKFPFYELMSLGQMVTTETLTPEPSAPPPTNTENKKNV